MKIARFNHVLYKGNINKNFYFYCLKKKPVLLIYPFITFVFWILTFISKRFNDLYENSKYKYLKKVNNLEKEVKDFYNKKSRINDNVPKVDIIIEKIPRVLIKKDICKNVIAYDLTEDYKIDKKNYDKELSKIKAVEELYVRHINDLDNIKATKINIVILNCIIFFKRRFPAIKNLKSVLSVIAVSLFLTCISFLFTSIYFDPNLIKTYFDQRLFMLNFLPTFLFISLLTMLTKRVHIAYLIDSTLLLILGIANQTMLLYRNDVVKISEVLLFREAAIMTSRYDIYIKNTTVLAIIAVILVFFVIKKFVPKLQIKLKKQIFKFAVIFIIAIFINKNILHSEEAYKSVADGEGINVVVATSQSQSRGLVYPFTYSYTELIHNKPADYNEKNVEKIMEKYKYSQLKENEKVNVIAIMLEAYQDMSKWDNIKIDEEVYKEFHDIEKESISGEIVTTVLGGGTVYTERRFLTGFNDFPDFRTRTNSYAWYFKEQGYRTEAMHPLYGSFYNRNTIYASLGFDEYYNYDNYFKKIDEDFVGDQVFFENIIKQYEKAKKNNIPYFNFSVTYQNHGPYHDEDDYERKYFFDQKNYDKQIYNAVNSYLTGIQSTNEALTYLIDYFDKEEEPTIIILFGDHNPYISEGTRGFEELGINMDTSSDEGFDNYYKTPYVIHANDSAKKVFNKDFVGEGESMSPMFLMSYLFEYCGIKGNEYNQYLKDLREKTSIIHPSLYKNGNVYVRLTNKTPKIVSEYQNVNYYYATNFHYKG